MVSLLIRSFASRSLNMPSSAKSALYCSHLELPIISAPLGISSSSSYETINSTISKIIGVVHVLIV